LYVAKSPGKILFSVLPGEADVAHQDVVGMQAADCDG